MEQALDRILASKWLWYLSLALAIAYLWENYYWLSNACRVFVAEVLR